ncbi:MAG: MATE family efflux transporter [Treponema sp.]|nr:MATE family efflux transporter [Treponema sp.]
MPMQTKSVDMTQGNIASLLVRFAVPLLIGNVFQQLYNTVDCVIVGNVLGKDALGAVGSTTHIIWALIGFFNGFSTGAGVVISQAFGAKKYDDLQKAVHTTLAGTLILGAFMTVFGIVVSPLILRLISTPAEIFVQADVYLKIYFGGIVFLMLYNMGAGILRATGDSKRPLYFLLFSSVLNIGFDVLFVVLFRWGIAGAAYATVLAEIISAAFVLYLLMRTDDVYKLRLRKLQIDIPTLKRIIAIGLPGGISGSITYFSNTFMQRYFNYFGSACTAAWASFSKVDQFSYLPMTSISFSVATFVGQNYGAKQYERIRHGIRVAVRIGLVSIGIISAIVFACAEQCISLFSREPDVIRFGVIFIHAAAPWYFLCCLSMTYSQVMRGLGNVVVPTVTGFCGFVATRQIYLFVVSRVTDSFTFIPYAYPLGWPVALGLGYSYYRYYTKRHLWG